jgi:hypothetical protein
VENLTDDIMKPIETMVVQHEKIVKDLEKEGSLLFRRLKELSRLVDESRSALTVSNHRYEESINNLNGATQISPDVRVKLYMEAGQSSLAFQEASKRVQSYIEAKDDYLSNEYLDNMHTILNMIEDIVTTHQELVRSSVQKYIVFEIALCRGLQYELENVFKLVENQIEQGLEISPNVPTKPEHESCPVPIQIHETAAPGLSIVEKISTVVDFPVERKIIEAVLSPFE